MGSVSSRLGINKSSKITHSDIDGHHSDDKLKSKIRPASKQSERQDCTQGRSVHLFLCFGQKNRTGLKEETSPTWINSKRNDISDNARAKHKAQKLKTDEKDKAEILKLKNEIRQLKHEKDQLLTRVSEIGAARLLHNNPNLADLSDPNRPEKLMNQFAEIYDNEWTNAFEWLNGKIGLHEEDAIKKLLDILRVIYTECLTVSRKHTTRLKKAIVRYLGIAKKTDELVLKETETRLSEYRGKNPGLNIAIIQKKIKKQLKEQAEDTVYEATETYMEVCSQLCWLMCIKEPPMHLHFDDCPASANDHSVNPGFDDCPGSANDHSVNPGLHIFNGTQFVSYTKIGIYVKYVVWPALFLYNGGPIMKKGVAQGWNGKNENNKITEVKDGVNVKKVNDMHQVSSGATNDVISIPGSAL